MGTLMMLLGGVCWLASCVCAIIILIAAFRDEVWKGLVCLVCGFYWLYYAFVEFDHENKWVIVAVALLGGAVGSGLFVAGNAMAAH